MFGALPPPPPPQASFAPPPPQASFAPPPPPAPLHAAGAGEGAAWSDKGDETTNPSISSEQLAMQRGQALAMMATQGVGESSQYGAQAIGEASMFGALPPPPPPQSTRGFGPPSSSSFAPAPPSAGSALISDTTALTIAATGASADLLDARNQAQKLAKVAEGFDERAERDRVTLGWTLAVGGIIFYLLGEFTHKYPIVVGGASIILLLPASALLFVGRSRIKVIERTRWLRQNGDLMPARILAVRELGAPQDGKGSFSVRMEIRHPGKGAYDAMVRVELPPADLPREGTELSVRVNPMNQYEVTISN